MEKRHRTYRSNTATEKLLKLIDSTPGGMRFTEIQRAMWLLRHPGGDVKTMSRGSYCTYFLGEPFYHAGVLRFFCRKDPQTGRWVRNPDVPIQGPWKRQVPRAIDITDYCTRLRRILGLARRRSLRRGGRRCRRGDPAPRGGCRLLRPDDDTGEVSVDDEL